MELFMEGNQYLFLQIQHRFSFLEHGFLYLSSFGINEFQIIQIPNLFFPGIEEDIQAVVGRSDSASRVDPWSDDISDMIGIYRSLDLQKIQKSLEWIRQVFAGVQKLQSLFYHHPILVHQRDDVGYGSDSHDRKEIIEYVIFFFLVEFWFAEQCADKFEGHSYAGESFKWIIGRNYRIHYRYGFRNCFHVLVMIGDDEIDSLFFGVDGFL